ncbi:hypothetical protein [uncultured Enterovirga sp.]|uniref:hypothetical protein n=1 Tax=uncultured Enterovirga sp. TaxID=2026352 RepID=UPI0035CC0657
MASDAAALVVRLEAKLDQFERQLKQAGVIADDSVSKIESSFARANPAASGIGVALGAGLALGAAAGIKLVEGLFDRFKRLQETAELTGTSLSNAFAVEKLLGEGALKGFDKIGTLLDRMGRGEENALSKLFDANGVKNVKDVGEAFDKVVDLIQRAPNRFQANEMGAGLGIDSETVGRIREASGEFSRLRAEAAAAAPDLQRLADLSKEFDDLWKRALTAVKAYVAETAHEMAVPIAQFVETTMRELQALLGSLRSVGGVVDSLAGESSITNSLDGQISALERGRAALRDFIDKRAPLAITVNKGPPSRPAPIGRTGGGGGGEKDTLDAFEREERRATETAERLAVETRALGLNDEQRTKAIETLRLEQMLKREGIEIDAAYAARIDETSTKLAKATAAYAEAQRGGQQNFALQTFAGQELIDALDGAIMRGEKLSEVFANVVQSIARAALQAAILGQGPLAGLFGTASSTSGQAGGLIGSIASLFGGGGSSIPARAAGGPVSAGQPYLVGERGPELLVPRNAGMIVPNNVLARGGGGGVSLSLGDTHIDARGSTMGQGEFNAILDQRDRRLAGQLSSQIRDLRGRGRI